MKQFRKGMLVGAVGLVLALAAAAVVHLKGRDVESAEQTAASPSALLLADIQAYRADAATLEPQTAAARWFGLYDRATALGKDSGDADYIEIDINVLSSVSERSMFASLPPPAAWPAFREIATQRKELPLRYLAEVLNGDRAAATATLTEIDSRESRAYVVAARALLAKLYGDAEERVGALKLELQESAGGYVEVPDLVAMVGEARAAELLKIAVTSPHVLRIEGGEATGALARRLAIANIDRMQVPQWALAENIGGASLYEAISKRFSSKVKEEGDQLYNWSWQQATAYYFLSMVKDGRQGAAEEALLNLSGEGAVSIPHDVVAALERAGLNEPLFRFLDGQLARRPELAAWDLYLEQAAYTGHGADAMALISRLLARKDLSREMRADLRIRHADALLAADNVKEAAAEFRELLSMPPAAGEPMLSARTSAALRAAGVGRLTGDKQLAELGVRFAQAAVQLPAERRFPIRTLGLASPRVRRASQAGSRRRGVAAGSGACRSEAGVIFRSLRAAHGREIG